MNNKYISMGRKVYLLMADGSHAQIATCDVMVGGGKDEAIANATLIATALTDQAEIDRLRAENEQLRAERLLMARIASDEPKFSNPLHVARAYAIRDAILAEEALKGGQS